MAAEDTLPKLLKRNYERWGDRRVAMREKDFGIWKCYTWKDYYQNVKVFSLGLISLGLERGDKVAIIGDNRPQWYWAELAAQAAGAIVLGAFPDANEQEVKYILENSDSKFVVLKDQEQVDKILQIKDELPKLKKAIYWDPKGLRSYDNPILMDYVQVVELGREYEKTHQGLFEENVEKGNGGDIAFLSYTSGTSGSPKAAMLSYTNMLFSVEAMVAVSVLDDTDEYVSFIPPAWILDQLIGISTGLYLGMKVNFPEKPETVQSDSREIAPTYIVLAPRMWENMCHTIQAKIIDTTFLKKKIFHIFFPVGYRMADLFAEKKKPNILWRILYHLADVMLFRSLRDNLGLPHARNSWTGGGTLGAEAVRFFRAMGINIKQCYAATECGMAACHRDDDIKFESVGTPMPGVKIDFTDTGEVMISSRGVFQGYYKDPEKSRKVLKDGWWVSGDAGLIDEDGHLIIVDRIDDVMDLKEGGRFSPSYIESRLKFGPYVKDALVIGGKEYPYVSAVLNIDFENVSRWAEMNKLVFTTYADLSQKPEVYDLVQKQVEAANKVLAKATRIRRFTNFPKELDADEAELTRTRKVRRSYFESRYSLLLDSLYHDKEEATIEMPVVYRDGRKGTVRNTVKVRTLAGD